MIIIQFTVKFRKHSIIIRGARPDIYEINDFKQIFAVEVKGLEDYKNAIGQILIYKSGVNIFNQFIKLQP